ncbi:hypothetical protein STEG23_019662, partial [Scotinomys teguina]
PQREVHLLGAGAIPVTGAMPDSKTGHSSILYSTIDTVEGGVEEEEKEEEQEKEEKMEDNEEGEVPKSSADESLTSQCHIAPKAKVPIVTPFVQHLTAVKLSFFLWRAEGERQSSEAQTGTEQDSYAPSLQFSFSFSRELSLVPDCTPFCGQLGKEHRICRKKRVKGSSHWRQKSLSPCEEPSGVNNNSIDQSDFISLCNDLCAAASA